jgi:hypothetical protein
MTYYPRSRLEVISTKQDESGRTTLQIRMVDYSDYFGTIIIEPDQKTATLTWRGALMGVTGTLSKTPDGMVLTFPSSDKSRFYWETPVKE